MNWIRTGVRIPLELPVNVRWKSHGRGYRQVQGKTGSISGNGLFVTIPAALPRGTPITFTITLPAEITKVPFELQCRGRVVRSSRLEQGSGVGAIIDDYQFRPAPKPV